MDGFRHLIVAQGAVDFFRDIRDERRGSLCKGDEHIVQRGISICLVRIVLALPETAAAAADVPVCQVVGKGFKAVCRLLELIAVHGFPDLRDHISQCGKDPAVQRVCGIFGRDRFASRGIPVIQVCISHKELETVPDGEQNGTHDLFDAVFGELEVFRTDDLGFEEEEAERIGTVAVDHIHGVGIVFQALAHLLSVFRENHAVDDDMEGGGLVKEGGGKNREGVEPAAGLVLTFRDEVGGEHTFKMFLVHEGIMLLGVGHGAAFKPAVQHFRHALEDGAGLGGFDLHGIHKVLVNVGDLLTGEFFQFGNGAHADHLAGFVVFPDGQGAAPVPVAADRPVTGIFQPLAETAGLDVFGDPCHLFVGTEHFFFDAVDADEPGGDRFVDQRGIVAPAMGIAVLDGAAVDQFAFHFEAFHDQFIRILHKETGVVRHFGREFTFGIDGADTGDAAGSACFRVLFPETGSDVNNTGTIFRADVFRIDDPERTLRPFLRKVGEQRFVGRFLEVGAFEPGNDLRHGVLLVVGGKTGFRQDVECAVVVDLDVIDFRPHGERHVAGQGPGSGGPGEDVGVFFIQQFEADRDGGIDHIHIALIRFKVGERRAAACAVGEDLVTFVDQVLVPQLLEDPPDGFHVFHVHGAVTVLEIDPAPHALDDRFPLGSVTEHDTAAGFVELVDAVFFDLFFAVQVQIFFHFVLDRQTVAVPAEGAFAIFAQHGLVTGNDILDRAGEEVSVVGQTGGERRTIVEDVFRIAFAVLKGFFKRAVLLPELERGFFDLGEF